MTEEMTTQNVNHAYEVVERNLEDGTVTLRINKGILGALGNQLKSTSDKKRKGASILRKLGYDLADAGDFLYSKQNQGSVI
jgi:hypothetical protein